MIIMQEKIKNAQAPAENSAPKKSKFKTIDVVYIGEHGNTNKTEQNIN